MFGPHARSGCLQALPRVVYRRQTSLFCGAACGTSMHDFDPTNKRGYTTKVVILLGQSYNTPW